MKLYYLQCKQFQFVDTMLFLVRFERFFQALSKYFRAKMAQDCAIKMRIKLARTPTIKLIFTLI